jgi:hypothetical protein
LTGSIFARHEEQKSENLIINVKKISIGLIMAWNCGLVIMGINFRGINSCGVMGVTIHTIDWMGKVWKKDYRLDYVLWCQIQILHLGNVGTAAKDIVFFAANPVFDFNIS